MFREVGWRICVAVSFRSKRNTERDTLYSMIPIIAGMGLSSILGWVFVDAGTTGKRL